MANVTKWSYRVWLGVAAFIHLVLVWALTLSLSAELYAVMFALLISSVVATAVFTNLRWDISFTTSIFLFACISVLFLLTFLFPRSRVNEALLCTKILEVETCQEQKQLTRNYFAKIDNTTLELIKVEHTKAIEEIKQRIIIDDQWYYTKFFLIGGLFAAFLRMLSLL